MKESSAILQIFRYLNTHEFLEDEALRYVFPTGEEEQDEKGEGEEGDGDGDGAWEQGDEEHGSEKSDGDDSSSHGSPEDGEIAE